MGLAGAGRADQQHVGGRFQVAAGGQLLDELAVGGGLGVVVELLQGGRGGQGGEAQPAGQPACLGRLDLEGKQPFQGGGQRQFLGGGVVEHGGQCFGGGVQLERGQMGAQLLVEAGLRGRDRCRGRCRGHRRVFLPWAAAA